MKRKPWPLCKVHPTIAAVLNWFAALDYVQKGKRHRRMSTEQVRSTAQLMEQERTEANGV